MQITFHMKFQPWEWPWSGTAACMPFGEGASEMAALPNFCIMSQRGEKELERTESRLKGKGWLRIPLSVIA